MIFSKTQHSMTIRFYKINDMKKIFIFLLILISFATLAQTPLSTPHTFTHDDTLRGTITPERAWWDLKHNALSVRVSPEDSSIVGDNILTYKVLKPYQIMQIDLQPPLKILKIIQGGKTLSYTKEGTNAYFVKLQSLQKVGAIHAIRVYYSGKPHIAKRAPWDGGFSWKRDAAGQPFVATSCQGLGASVWWACKDHNYDEPDSQSIAVTVPKNLMDVSNGRLQKTTDNKDGTKTYLWGVKNPINNYGTNVNIANYVHFGEDYQGEKGKLTMDYYVLPENLEKAKKQFTQAKDMMKAFEHWFGPYPFYEDGYKLVEVPYLGMEHQSSVTYGNHYQNGYLGRDLSGTGWGLKWDFIIVHESGHEWFANNITYKDVADMWIHESFTNYSECLFTEFYHGKEAGAAYVIGCRKNIRNESPIIGIYNVNYEGSGDMYYKGGNMLHTIRQIVNDDELWRQTLRGLNKEFYHQTVETQQIENYMSQKSGINLSKVFDQYLRNTQIPTFAYEIENGQLTYRWETCVTGFDMPLKVTLEDGKMSFINPTTTWQSTDLKLSDVSKFGVDINFYVKIKN